MRLLIFGATGKTGLHLVNQALSQGHLVSAFARNPAKLPLTHANLTMVTGDVMQPSSIAAALPGHDAVLSAIGDGDKRSTLRTDGTANIMAEMHKAKIRRFICTSTLGIRDSKNVLPPLYKYILVPFILKHAFADHAKQEELVERSPLSWTIIRPAALTDGQLTNRYYHGAPIAHKRLKLKISRADVAEFMLLQLNSSHYLCKAVGLSY